MSVIPEGRLIKVEFEFRLPATATKEQIEEWLRFFLGSSGGIDFDHPLIDCEPAPFPPAAILLTDTLTNGHVEDSDRRVEADGSTHYKRRYIRERVQQPS